MSKDNSSIVWQDRKRHLWFPISFTKYYIENERLMIQTGFLNTTLEETLLYRIVDITLRQSFGGKIFGTGDLILKVKVDKTPEIILKNIKNPRRIRQLLSEMVEESRHSRNVVGKEFYGSERSHDHEFVDMNQNGICDHEEE